MTLRDLVQPNYEQFPDPKAAKVADEVFPELFDGDKAPQYRMQVFQEFRRVDALPLRDKRSEAETRFDRALDKVAAVHGKHESTVQTRCTSMYDGETDGEEDMTKRFIREMLSIEQRLED